MDLFVDLSVYSRNRAFRLYKSSKMGKTAVLNVTPSFLGQSGMSEESCFYASLISPTDAVTSKAAPIPALLLQGRKRLTRMAGGVRRHRTRRRMSLLIMDNVKDPQMGPLPQKVPSMKVKGVSPSGLAPCYGPSPYPELEHFLESVCIKGGVQGHIRSWLHQPDLQLVLFNMKDNRWCDHVQRVHKSNGIYYVVDLRVGCWYQKCYDPDCRHYRSPGLPLPPHIWQQYNGQGGQGEMEMGSDDEGADILLAEGAGCLPASMPMTLHPVPGAEEKGKQVWSDDC